MFRNYTNDPTTIVNSNSFIHHHPYIRFNRAIEPNNMRIITKLKRMGRDNNNLVAMAAVLFVIFQNGEDTDDLIPDDFTLQLLKNLSTDGTISFTNHHSLYTDQSAENLYNWLAGIYSAIIRLQKKILMSTPSAAVRLIVREVPHLGQFSATQIILLLIDAGYMKLDTEWTVKGTGSKTMLKALTPNLSYTKAFFQVMKQLNDLAGEELFNNVSWEHILCKSGMYATHLIERHLDPIKSTITCNVSK